MGAIIFWMESLNESESLVIAEGRPDFDIDSSESKTKREEDLFELSRDDLTLSFQIEEDQRLSLQDPTPVPLQPTPPPTVAPIVPEERRKRREIFDKSKKPPLAILAKLQSPESENNLMNLFDSIFKPKAGEISQQPSPCQLNPPQLTPPQIDRSRTPSAERRERVKIFGKKTQVGLSKGVAVGEGNGGLQGSNGVQSAISKQERVLQQLLLEKEGRQLLEASSPINRKERSFNFSQIERGCSEIEKEENLDMSRDSLDIDNILQSEIFRQEQDRGKRQSIRKNSPNKETMIPLTNRANSFKEVINLMPAFKQPDTKEEERTALRPSAQTKFQSIKEVQPKPQPQETGEMQLTLLSQRSDRTLIRTLQESKYIPANDFSVSSAPSVNIQQYQSESSRFIPENSMVNTGNLAFADVTSIKLLRPESLRNTQPFRISQNNLAESKLIFSAAPVVTSHLFLEQSRFPEFLRPIRRAISIYPNFYLQGANAPTTESVRSEFEVVIELFSGALSFLNSMCQQALKGRSVLEFYMGELGKNPTLEFFLESKWEQHNQFPELNKLKPPGAVAARKWDYGKAKNALSSYENLVGYYRNKGVVLDLSQSKGRRKYLEIRQKFWDVAGNMKLISEDIYCELTSCLFPPHFYLFLKALKDPTPLRASALPELKRVLHVYQLLRAEKDGLAVSEVGRGVRERVERGLKVVGAW